MNELTISLFLGSLVGLIQALTGAGGAILAVPLLLFGLGLGMTEAAPVALLAVSLSAAAGALLGLRARTVRYRAATVMAVSGMLLSPLGLWAAHRIPNGPLTLVFAATLAFVSIQMFRLTRQVPGKPGTEKHSLQPCRLNEETGRFIWTAPCTRALILSGAGAGFLSGLLGVGGGFVIVPALKRVTNAPMKSITATSLGVIAIVSGFGVASAAVTGDLNVQIGIPFAAGAIAGMLGGRLISDRLSGPKLQQGFAVMAGVVALGLVIKTCIS